MSAQRLKEKFALIIFGLIIGVVLLELGLRLGGWVFLSFQEHRNKVVSKDKGAYRILCLGESTTARSIELDEGESAYPSQLQEILNQRGLGRKFVVINEGVPGITTTGIVRQLPDNLNKYHPDIVITMMGINDYGILPHEDISLTGSLHFLRELKVYKLATLLWLHIANKLEELQERDLFLTSHSMEVRLKKEEERLQKAIAVNPLENRAYLALSSYYLDLARFQEAEEILKKAIELNPKDCHLLIALGSHYSVTGRFREAEKIFHKIIEISPRNYEIYLPLANCYKVAGELRKAEETLTKAIAINPEESRAYFKLGCFYKIEARYQDAERVWIKGLDINPKIITYALN